MPLVVRICLDRDACPHQLLEHAPQARESLPGDFLKLGPMLVDHPLVMIGGNGGQALRNEIIEGKAPFDLDHIPLLAEVLHGVHEQQFDATPFALRQPLASGRDKSI